MKKTSKTSQIKHGVGNLKLLEAVQISKEIEVMQYRSH